MTLCAADGSTIDMADYYPGPMARTHALRAVDGRYYRFSGASFTNGIWSRTIDPGYVDIHSWQPDGMYYLGWIGPGELHWSVPPERAMPRQWDPSTVWTQTFSTMAVAKRTAAGNWITLHEATLTLKRVVEGGETLFFHGGGSSDGQSGERWWISPVLPVHGGGVSPGFRRFELFTNGVVTGSATFVEWVPTWAVGVVPVVS